MKCNIPTYITKSIDSSSDTYRIVPMYNLQINVLSKIELRVWIILFSDDKKKK